MSVVMNPRPAELPLPGGREGATVRVHPLMTAELGGPAGFLEAPDGKLARLGVLAGGLRRSGLTWFPAPAFLVEHPGAGPVLVDTGIHASAASDPGENFGRLGKVLYPVRAIRPAADQLRERGFERGQIGVVVMTHLHYDHASAVADFPAATFLLDRREWDSAVGPRPWTKGYQPRQFDHAFDWRALDYDAPEVNSFATFAQSVDVFGDGSVRLLSTPGHTLGHQSVLLRTGEGKVLLCADAAYSRRTLAGDASPMVTADEHLFRRSLKEIQRFLAQTPEAIAIPGHDMPFWQTLKPVYG